jgi:lysozyme
MALPAEALDLIKSFEGYLKRLSDCTGRVAPYLCPAGVPTIGWGTTFYPGGRKVALADPPIGCERATECLAHELTANERDVDRLTTAKLHPLSRGALVSFVYNCGAGAYRASTLRRKVNEGAWSEVPRELAKWRMGGGRILPGLVRRRAAEAELFMRGVRAHDRGQPIADAPESTPPASPARGWWRTFLSAIDLS